MIAKPRITELWNQTHNEILELWREGECIIFRDHFVRLIEKEINEQRANSRAD